MFGIPKLTKLTMRKIFLIVALVNAMSALAQTRPDWENPEVFAINKENTRSTSIPYATEAQALKNHYSNSPFYKSLNGNWQFYWVDKIADVPKDFYLEENYSDNIKQKWKKGEPNQTSGQSGWTLMPVPGNWEFNGYGIPMYVNIGYGFTINPPFIDRNDSPTGAYRHKFEIPKDWDGRRVYLHFEAGTNSMYVWVNGKKVGYTENSKSPAEFDITEYIRPGSNLLACQVHKFSDGYYMEDQDMWRLGGINRNVYLYSTAQTRIQDFFSLADLDAKYKDGLFSAEVNVQNYTKSYCSDYRSKHC
jgi:beta-galactosidase